MKALLQAGRLLFRSLTAGGLLACASLSAADTNGLAIKLRDAVASRDIAVVNAALPDIEALWPRDPEMYFACMKEAALAANNSLSAYPEARSTVLAVYTNALSKPCPADEQKATACLWSKEAIALTSDYAIRESHQKSPLFYLARSLGEARSRMIPNYKNRSAMTPPGILPILTQAGTFNPEAIKDPALKKEYEKVMEQNRRDAVTDGFQLRLRMTDWTLSSRLLQHLSRFSAQDPENFEFIRQITAEARLTQEEQKKVQWNR